MHKVKTQVSTHDRHLIDALLRADAFEHPVDAIELVETHISWVILAGDYAYKIKKPIVLDFLDFGSLDKRKRYCEEEIRLNKPWAPELYVDVVAITGSADEPRFAGQGRILEYAVRMRRFDQDLRLDRQLAAGKLQVADMKELGQNIADRHAAADVPGKEQRERLLRQAIHYVWENFDHLDTVLDDDEFEFLHDWTARELDKLENTLRQRFDDGFVRDCHGDLHLGNLVRLPGGITTFDCIEFNADLRYTDVFADVGFLAMDLVEKGRHDLAAHFLNRYLECSGDYGGVKVFDLYFVYRCLVRAKVFAILSREREAAAERDTELREARAYCDMARRQASKAPRALIILSGLSGSGKTWLSERLMAALPAIRVRSDIERKRLFGLAETADSQSDVAGGIYSAEAGQATYQRLFELAGDLLGADHHVILDAAFLEADLREAARQVASDAACDSILISVTAPVEVLRDRIRQRAMERDEVSEADLDVLEYQLASVETPGTGENAIVVDTSGDTDVDVIVAAIRERLRN